MNSHNNDIDPSKIKPDAESIRHLLSPEDIQKLAIQLQHIGLEANPKYLPNSKNSKVHPLITNDKFNLATNPLPPGLLLHAEKLIKQNPDVYHLRNESQIQEEKRSFVKNIDRLEQRAKKSKQTKGKDKDSSHIADATSSLVALKVLMDKDPSIAKLLSEALSPDVKLKNAGPDAGNMDIIASQSSIIQKAHDAADEMAANQAKFNEDMAKLHQKTLLEQTQKNHAQNTYLANNIDNNNMGYSGNIGAPLSLSICHDTISKHRELKNQTTDKLQEKSSIKPQMINDPKNPTPFDNKF